MSYLHVHALFFGRSSAGALNSLSQTKLFLSWIPSELCKLGVTNQNREGKSESLVARRMESVRVNLLRP